MAYATEDVDDDDDNDNDDIEMPEAYGIYQQLKRFGTNWWAGGYADQPYVLMLEMTKVEEAIQKYKREQEEEALAKAIINNAGQ